MWDAAQARRNMVDCQLRTFDVSDRALLAAMDEVPRETFVPPARATLAYLDRNLALSTASDARTLLAPMTLARLIQALGLSAGDRVLDVAGGLGYAAAVMARLGAIVVALEDDPALSAEAGRRLAALDVPHPVVVRSGPLEAGASADGPFDAILVGGTVETDPTILLSQLADGGRLACLRHDGRAWRATLFVRSGDAFGSRTLFDATAPVLPAFRAAPAFVF